MLRRGAFVTYVFRLVVLDNAADSTRRGRQRRVEAVHVLLLGVDLRLGAVSDLERAGLVVGAVAARDELLVLALEGEPRLEVELLGRRVVERARDDGDDLVRQAETLVEVLRVVDHVVERLPRLLGVREQELLDLLELVDAVDAPALLAVVACLATVARAVASIPATVSIGRLVRS
jgi:hypothetical protein